MYVIKSGEQYFNGYGTDLKPIWVTLTQEETRIAIYPLKKLAIKETAKLRNFGISAATYFKFEASHEKEG